MSCGNFIRWSGSGSAASPELSLSGLCDVDPPRGSRRSYPRSVRVHAGERGALAGQPPARIISSWTGAIAPLF
jgi:hypothetical protein